MFDMTLTKKFLITIFIIGLGLWCFIMGRLHRFKDEKSFQRLKKITHISALANITYLIVILCVM